MDDEKLKNKILENTDTLRLNYDLMQLSNPIMGSSDYIKCTKYH